jgi:hypothetical protein
MWRYKLVPVPPCTPEESRIAVCEAELNRLGEEGWEAVAVVPQPDGSSWVLFKMPHGVATY